MSPKLLKATKLDDCIEVRGAKQHNLKDIDVTIPKNQLVVITGVSGSGKSSLAFDTIFAEGQRRYVESLSAYARQFLGQLDKPDVEEIKGLSPAISIDQKQSSYNPRSTVGTVTEIYDHLRLLFARIGTQHCPECDAKVEAQTIDQIIDQVMELDEGSKAMILAPLARGKKGEHQNLFSALKSDGFARVRVDGTIYTLEEEIKIAKTKKHDIDLVVDRVVIKASARSRIADSLSLALNRGEGVVVVHDLSSEKDHLFSELMACPNGHGSFAELDPKNFSFNSPHGACKACDGLGMEQELSEDLLVPVPALSLAEGAIKPWAKTNNPFYKALLDGLMTMFKLSMNTPFEDLPEDVQEVIFYGYDDKRVKIDTKKYPNLGYGNYNIYYEGVVNQLQRRYDESSSESWKAELEQYMVETQCPKCDGARLKPASMSVKIAGQGIADITKLSVTKADDFFSKLELFLNPHQQQIAHQLLIEIRSRLKFLVDVGLGYLTLSRSAKTLSGGEFQRIRLASQIGSSLTGVLYVLDEPSIGLHQRDNARLLATLNHLRELGNTVLVVEHDEETIASADYVVDIGPKAGTHGGEVVACGSVDDISAETRSITGDYLSGRRKIAVPAQRRQGNGKFLSLEGATKNNLKDISIDLPLGKFIAVTGVSGSGKSSLINDLLRPALMHQLGYKVPMPRELKSIAGYEELDKVIVIDQSPIGRTPRSNPATYVGVFDPIRQVFSQTVEAKARGYKPGRFSFNVKGGRCEACGGAGLVDIEMNFLVSVSVPCAICKGCRYNQETLEVKFKGKSIYDVLEMTVEEALEFFDSIPQAKKKLQALHDVGLDYVRLGQAATTLSGGEAQRIKLASELSKRPTGKTMYLLDEPTTGLHWYDVQHLLNVLNRLVDSGNTVLVIEHNLDVIKHSDHIIDLGPEGGEGGGELIAQGSPEELAVVRASHTAAYL
ncbi:MAG: excinuclease ABC subunit UvrA [Candidatus Melainabacteria bacterium]|nr:excinuclease ABC subunit UvrA [Candidatus Melainabacteria bacterium]